MARPPGALGWAVAIGGVVPKPLRISGAEECLGSERPSERDFERAAEIAARDAPFATDRRATETYRRRLVEVLVVRALREALGRQDAT